MIIEDDVAAVAREWGLDPKLVQAIVTQEGNILRAVQMSVPSCTTRAEALRILCRSITHEFGKWITMQPNRAFSALAFFGGVWAPLGVANDPHNLNVHWVPNVWKLWGVGGGSV